MSNLSKWSAKALEELDAAVFSGDEFFNPEARAELRAGLARLERGLKEFDASDVKTLVSGLREMVANHRLSAADIPDDFEWLCQTLDKLP